MEPTHFESLYPADSREREIKQIVDFVKKGDSCQLVSLPGVGRSNLLGMLSFNRNVRIKYFGEHQKWFHFVLANFSEVKGKPLADCIKFLFLSLADSLRDRKLIAEHNKLHTIFEEHYRFNDELVLFQGLKEAIDYISVQKELTVVFLFDRFEDYIPMLTPEFFSNLRTLRDRAKYRFSVVFSVNRPLEDMLEESLFSHFYEFFEHNVIYLPLMDKPSLEFRISYIEKVARKKLDKKVFDNILQLTAGHGKLTRLAAESLLFEKAPQDILSFLLKQSSIQKALKEIWNGLLPSEQKTLIQNQENKEYEFLERIGLLRNKQIQIPLFKEFIVRQLANKPAPQPISFNADTNTILKGNEIVSNSLTALEFRLLRFLIQNAGAIVERQSIIDAVWQDAKSTAGVTDQAVDQLVSRLRKKIEDTPNSPTHLLTIKGRGFQFVP